MKYNPKAGLLDDGEYDATIVAAEEKVSKAGNAMIEIVVRVYGGAGMTVEVLDWLMEAMPWKMLHLSNAIGHNFESGEIGPEDLINENVRVKVTAEENEQYGKRNRIADYVGKPSKRDPDIPF